MNLTNPITDKLIAIVIGLLWGLLFVSTDSRAQVHLVATDDANTSNDEGGGPTAVNDRSDFVAIRNFMEVGNTRKRIGYFKYDITGVDPILFPLATLSGSFTDGRDGDGTFTVFGLNDGVMNLDDVPGGTFTEANWSEGSLTYAMGLGVDNSVALSAVGDLGIDPNETTELGTITLVDGEPFLSNTTDLPLGDFLDADTNGVVTFLIADLVGETEWRTVAREASSETSVRLSMFPTPGDTDLDGTVEPEDLDPIRANYRMENAAFGDGDLNGNGIVDFPDFRIWKTAFLNTGAGSLAGVDLGFLAVPEPAAMWLCGLGIVGFGALGGRRRVSRPTHFEFRN